jgi:hypothetical protein
MILNSTKKGLIAESEFLKWILQRGYSDICEPIEHDLSYDFLIFCSIQNKWLKVQVKSAYFCKKGTARSVNFRRGRSKGRSAYVEGDFDWMFIFDSETNKRYWIPWTTLSEIKSSFTVSSDKFDKYRITV